LKQWIAIRPANALTVLDTHDGIGVIDIGAEGHQPGARKGLVNEQGIERLVQQIHANSGGESLRATGAAASNLDLYQVNCTFYDALGRDDLRYLLSRAIQFFLPGIPQVYYVGLLAGTNDMQLLATTQVGRDINRHHYSAEEIAASLARPVVRDLFALIALRNTHPAFQGQFHLRPSGAQRLEIEWRQGTAVARLGVDMRTGEHVIEVSGEPALLQFQVLNVGALQPA
jgi:sucrose phosphorylase